LSDDCRFRPSCGFAVCSSRAGEIGFVAAEFLLVLAELSYDRRYEHKYEQTHEHNRDQNVEVGLGDFHQSL